MERKKYLKFQYSTEHSNAPFSVIDKITRSPLALRNKICKNTEDLNISNFTEWQKKIDIE